MHLKRYAIFSTILLIALGLYIHVTVGTNYTENLFGIEVTLPTAVWVMLPAILLFLATVGHMAFYGMLAYLKNRSVEKDLKQIKKLVLAALTGEKSAIVLGHPSLKPIGKLLASATIVPDGKPSTGDEELDKAGAAVVAVQSGATEELAPFKLPKGNKYVVKNWKNRLNADEKVAEEVLKECREDEALAMEAAGKLAAFGEKKRVEKNEELLDTDGYLAYLKRYRAPEYGIEFSEEEIIGYAKKAGFAPAQFVELAQTIRNRMDPDSLLALFFRLKNEFENAGLAYLYVNLELEKVDEVKEFLEQSTEEEYRGVRAYLVLKSQDFRAPVEDFLY